MSERLRRNSVLWGLTLLVLLIILTGCEENAAQEGGASSAPATGESVSSKASGDGTDTNRGGGGQVNKAPEMTVPTTLSDKAQASKRYYVSPSGSDDNAGTKEQPFLTLEAAMLAVNAFKKTVKDDMEVVLMDGNHYRSRTFELTAMDNLPDNKTLTFRADDQARPVIVAGVPVSNWEAVTLNEKPMYRAKMEGIDHARTFYVGEEAMELASAHKAKEERLSWDWKAGTKLSSIELGDFDLEGVVNPGQLEVVWIVQWKVFIHKAESVARNVVNMLQPYFSYATTPVTVGQVDPGGYWYPNTRYPVYLQNDISFIDEPGEFAYNELDQYLYYYPKHGENPNKKEAIVSKLDTIIRIKGDLSYQLAKNIVFDGLTIGYGGFGLVSEQGFAAMQAQHYVSGVTTTASSGVRNTIIQVPDKYIEGNIVVSYAKNIQFLNNDIINTAKGGIHINNGVDGAVIRGNYFKDIGDSAIVVGNGHAGNDTGLKQTKNVVIENNVTRRTGRVNFTSPAISVYYSNNNRIAHNDIYDTPFSGIAVGWGWYVMLNSKYSNNNVIEYNKVGNFNNMVRDGGGIYTLGQSPNSTVRNNYIYEQHEAYGGLYHDEGSSGYVTENNVVDNNTNFEESGQTWLYLNGFETADGKMTVYDLTIRNNYTSNPRMIHHGDVDSIVLDNNHLIEKNEWPDEAKAIMAGSGVESAYSKLLDKYPSQ